MTPFRTAVLLLLAAFGGGVLARWATPLPVHAQSADSGGRYVAVAAPYQQGVSLLYVLDEKTQHLAVYEAHGGGLNSREVHFVGARDIRLDTLLDGYNDRSEYDYKALEKEFQKRQLGHPTPTPALEKGQD